MLSSGLSTIAIYDSANDKTVIYLHTGASYVSVSNRVSKGQLIAKAKEGSKGASSAHTHVEVRNGRKTNAAKSVNDYVNVHKSCRSQ